MGISAEVKFRGIISIAYETVSTFWKLYSLNP